MKLIIKEVEKNCITPKYLIYLSIESVNILAFFEIGDVAKNFRINELILEHFIHDNKEIIIEEIS